MIGPDRDLRARPSLPCGEPSLRAFTNRSLHLASLVRQLHRDWLERQHDTLRAQIENMRLRLGLIRWMQLHGAASLLLCVVSMVAVMLGANLTGWIAFFAALLLMGASLVYLVLEVWCSGGALKILRD